MASTMLEGMYRIVHRDHNDNTIAELLEKHSLEFGGATGVPITDAQPMPKVKKPMSTILKEDDKLVIMFRPTIANAGAHTADGDRFLRVPVTYRNRRSGVLYEKTLTLDDFTNLIPHQAADPAAPYAVGRWYDVEEYVIPAQSEVKLGHGIQDVRVDSALYLQRDCDPV